MSAWTPAELASVDRTDELGVTSYRADGTLRPYVTIWMVRLGDDVYIRSAYGPENGWFRRARAAGRGRVRFDAVERDVTFEAAPVDLREPLDELYREKYRRYPARIVDSVVGPALAEVTFRLVPTDG